jgi:hypothetical protein
MELGVTGGDAIVFPDGAPLLLADAERASAAALTVGVEAELA